MRSSHRRTWRPALRTGAAAAALALTATACTTAVSGAGRPAAGARGSAAGSPTGTATGAEVLPSGAPTPPAPRYPGSSPEERSYLNARDASYAASAMTAKGPFSYADHTWRVDAQFGADGGTLFGSCTLLVDGAAQAEVRAVGDSTVAKAPAPWWRYAGVADAAATQAADRWVAVTDIGGLAAGCASTVFFLTQFEPQDSDRLATGTEDGGTLFVITNRTTGIRTVVDHDSGRIAEIRTSQGAIELTYPDSPLTTPTLPAGAEIVSVTGI